MKHKLSRGCLRLGCWSISVVAVLLVIAVVLLHRIDFRASPERISAFFADTSLAPRRSFVNEGSRKVFVVEVGNTEQAPVLFVHGSPGTWDNYLSYLEDPKLSEHAHLIAIDRPGFGDSGRGMAEPSLKNQAAAVLAALDRNRSGRPAILVGHSLGGAVVAQVAAMAPDRVGGLVLVAASVDPQLETVRWYQVIGNWNLIRLLLPPDLDACNQEILPLRSELESLLPHWAEFTMPITVIHGQADRLVPVANAHFVQAQVSKSQVELVVLPELSHFVPWTRPELINEAILSMLDRKDSTHEQPHRRR